jgi:hypothetical protein
MKELEAYGPLHLGQAVYLLINSHKFVSRTLHQSLDISGLATDLA